MISANSFPRSPHCLITEDAFDAFSLNNTSSKEDIETIYPVCKENFDNFLQQNPSIVSWVKRNSFSATSNNVLRLFDNNDALAGVLAGFDDMHCYKEWSVVAKKLGHGFYKIDKSDPKAYQACMYGFAMEKYKISHMFNTPKEPRFGLICKTPYCHEDQEQIRLIEAVWMIRDLINLPANILNPTMFAAIAKNISERHGGHCNIIKGDELLKQNFPMIHAVGRASSDPGCLIDINWGEDDAPSLVLIGKAVCFDTGGLDIKSASNMLLMKKDMGGGAHALALAHLIMSNQCHVKLRVLIPTVENAISSNAYRPSDILTSRSGLTVEIGDTDAEGRLILADAITFACEKKPDYIFDFATLTGAARVALGKDIPALFCNDDELANGLIASASKEDDAIWRLPLAKEYESLLKTNCADLSSTGSTSYGGAILAALFLQNFVTDDVRWAHVDMMAWNTSSQPGKPKGGEAMGLRCFYAWVKQVFGSSKTELN